MTKDAILYTYNPSTFQSKYLNASEQKNFAVELEANYTRDKWTLSGNYTFTDGKTTSGFDGTGTPIGKDTTYFNLYRIPRHAFTITAGYEVNKNVFFSVRSRGVGEREEFIYGSTPEILKGYVCFDVYGEYKFDKRVRLFADLKNITNKQYFDIRGYNSRRFNFMVGVNFQI
jgi:vitamin B12 transporter